MNDATYPTILKSVTELCVEVLRVPLDKVCPSARLIEDLDVDSLFVIQLAMALEEKFNVEVPEDDMPRFKTVDDIVLYLQPKLEAA